jgi:hypothetical protein
MPTRYTRFGEFFMQGVAKALAEGTTIDVPHVGRCVVRNVQEPHLLGSNWGTQVDISFPGSDSQMTIGMYTFGSCLLDDTEAITLPDATYEDEADKEFPTEHQEAWYRVLDALEAELEAAGYAVGSADDSDFYIITDYMPSNGISCSVLKPKHVSHDLISRCQRIVKTESEWNIWIRLEFNFVDKRHKGHNEHVLVRPDRVVHDYDATRLAAEFPNELPLLSAGDA